MKRLLYQMMLVLCLGCAMFFSGCAQTGVSKSGSVLVSLEGANEYEVVEIFGKIIHATHGVVDAKNLSQEIVPNNPQECKALWQVESSSKTDIFRLQTNIMKRADDVINAQGQAKINGVPFRYSPSDVYLLMGLVPASTTSQSIRFIIDRDRARERQLSNG